jgi:hypothetical protein
MPIATLFDLCLCSRFNFSFRLGFEGVGGGQIDCWFTSDLMLQTGREQLTSAKVTISGGVQLCVYLKQQLMML